MVAMAESLGAPVIEPQGKMLASSAPMLVSGRSVAVTSETI